MILVDTSVWVDHLRHHNRHLVELLDEGEVLGHPWVVGELALGNLNRREDILALLAALPPARAATDIEVAFLIERQPLFGLGIGLVDAALLAAARLTPDCRLWSRDRRLHEVATGMGLAHVGGRP